MPQAFGLTDKGFKAKDFHTIKDDLEAELRKEVDPTLHFGAGSVAGILTAIVAHQARQVWEIAQGLYHSLQPNTATDKALDALCSLTGTYRRKATYSRVKAWVTLESKTTLPKDSRIQTIGGHFFITTAEVENKTHSKKDIEADFIAEQPGPLSAHTDTIATIMTPTAGWSKAVIKHTYELGHLDEIDDELRMRRIDELKAKGSSTCEGIKARLRQLDHVEEVHIKENAHSFEAIVKGGKDEEIAHTIWQCKPLGIDTAGAIAITLSDSIGQSHIIRFSRPEMIHFELKATLKVKKLLEQAQIDAIKNALVDFSVAHFRLGAEVYPSRLYGAVLTHPHILDVTNLQLQERPPTRYPTGEIKPHQIASLGFSDITIQQIVEVAQ